MVSSFMKWLFRFLMMAAMVTQLTSCIFEGTNEKLTGRYRLSATDIDIQMHVSYELESGDTIGRIPETVFSVGWNDRYIVAKQHPKNDRTVTNYFYLEMARDNKYADPSASVTGPLSADEFEKKKTKLGLPPFSRTIEKLK